MPFGGRRNLTSDTLVLRHCISFKSQFGNSFFGRGGGDFLLWNLHSPKSLLFVFIALGCHGFETLPDVEEGSKQKMIVPSDEAVMRNLSFDYVIWTAGCRQKHGSVTVRVAKFPFLEVVEDWYVFINASALLIMCFPASNLFGSWILGGLHTNYKPACHHRASSVPEPDESSISTSKSLDLYKITIIKQKGRNKYPSKQKKGHLKQSVLPVSGLAFKITGHLVSKGIIPVWCFIFIYSWIDRK